ncbi:hypothetical protein CEXT_426521 [Caerostris extrusa]|uniref:Anoctamin n=1 Tax=Caerostris extrusa TaxID=172846 RepID=A0AAV4Y2U7_CAEEX|nr:hypothetical protein CEXT_426521 [Caerostris extrusa]
MLQFSTSDVRNEFAQLGSLAIYMILPFPVLIKLVEMIFRVQIEPSKDPVMMCAARRPRAEMPLYSLEMCMRAVKASRIKEASTKPGEQREDEGHSRDKKELQAQLEFNGNGYSIRF